MERAPVAKLDQVVQEVEDQVCSGGFNREKGCENICGGCRVPHMPGEA